MVACVRDGRASVGETLRTLKFTMSCARITSKPIRFMNPNEKLISDLREQISLLANENAVLRSSLVQGKREEILDGGLGDLRANNMVQYRADSSVLEDSHVSGISSVDGDKISQLEERIRRIESNNSLASDMKEKEGEMRRKGGGFVGGGGAVGRLKNIKKKQSGYRGSY
jgi:hypothetical protein